MSGVAVFLRLTSVVHSLHTRGPNDFAPTEFSAMAPRRACGALPAFINLVTKAGKKVPSGQAAGLIDAATGIRTLIGC